MTQAAPHPRLRFGLSLAAAFALAACADTTATPTAAVPQAAPQPAAAAAAPVRRPGAAAQSAAQLDTTTAEQRAAAAAPAAGGQELGRAVVSLGSPAEQGFWLRTPLVSQPTPGRVVAANGASANVDLIPASDTGGRMSLAAFQLLNLPLTSLPEVRVFTR